MPHNRGNKLKRHAKRLNTVRSKLRAPYGYHDDLEYIPVPSGRRRPIIYKIPRNLDRMLEYSGDEDDSPYKDIKIDGKNHRIHTCITC